MRRIESDPEEQREIQEALTRAATPTHEQPTEEFDSRAVIRGLSEFGAPYSLQETPTLPDNKWKKRLRDPPELGFEPDE